MINMEFRDELPLMIYDDKCYVCIKFAKLMNFIAKGKLRMIGHYTEFGKTIREEILEEDALEMFWFIDKETAYGGRAAIFNMQDGYDAARLLLDSLWVKLAPEFKGNFYVAAPARDMFMAISCGPDSFVEKLQNRIELDYKRMPYPISSDLFLVTQDGVAGTRAA